MAGSGNVLDILIEQVRRTVAESAPPLEPEELTKAEAFLNRVRNVRAGLVVEPRLTVVAVYRWGGDRFEADRIYWNPQPGAGHALNEQQRATVAAALGFGA